MFDAQTLLLVEKFKPDAATKQTNHSSFSCSRVTNQLESSLGERVFSRAWLWVDVKNVAGSKLKILLWSRKKACFSLFVQFIQLCPY